MIIERKDAFLAWHGLPDDGRLAAYDGCIRLPGTEAVEAGKVYTAPGPVVRCRWGLHWSRRAIDILRRTPGRFVERVLVWGEVDEEEDKGASTHRQCLAVADASQVYHEFARDWAERALWALALTTGEPPHLDSLRAIEVKRRRLKGEATDEELRTTAEAAEAAVWAARAAAEAEAAVWAAFAKPWRAAARAAAVVMVTRAAAAVVATLAAEAVTWAVARAAMAETEAAMNADLESRLLNLLGYSAAGSGNV
ncbi:MAG: hypothetical protein C4521_07715 [Actinobacteria bacterium]|nr:MAG: hypothetical protein C4521_07715 [Actinomycetota bacterium]